MSVILGIDPGLQHTGWGVVRQQGSQLSYIAGGVISTTPKTPDDARLAEIANGLAEVVQQYQPNGAAVEEVFLNVNPKTTLKLGQARGVCLMVPRQHGLQVAEYSARLVKQSVVGTGAASKEQVQHMVKILLPTASWKKADTADALAVAITHAHHATMLAKTA